MILVLLGVCWRVVELNVSCFGGVVPILGKRPDIFVPLVFPWEVYIDDVLSHLGCKGVEDEAVVP